MTKEEAIRAIGWLKCTTNREDDLEAIDMAIEALSAAELKPKFESVVPNCQKCAIKELWEETEKEDLVAVVHCKDCRWWQDNNNGYPHANCHWCETETPDEDDFCSCGERRDPWAEEERHQ